MNAETFDPFFTSRLLNQGIQQDPAPTRVLAGILR